MLGLSRENIMENGGRMRYAPPITKEILRTKMMPEYSIDTRLPGIIDVTRVPTANGGVITVATDENGEIVGAETQPNWMPLALAAGAAYFFLM